MGRTGRQSTPIEAGALREAVLRWLERRPPRSIAIRERRDPYAVLVAELMAQQTQIERVADAWRSFLATFPTLEALARARPADVLRAWGNLGYNRRPIALLRAARTIVAEYGGIIPSDPALLERLPGIGSYTARAVAAVGYGRPVGPVDTNVRRVLGRLLDADGGAPAASVQALADALAAGAPDPGVWTYALMDLGATVCQTEPRCHACPLAGQCSFAGRWRSGPMRNVDRRSGEGAGLPLGPSDPRDRSGELTGSRRPGPGGRDRAASRRGDGSSEVSPRPVADGGRDRAASRRGDGSGRLAFPQTRRWLRGRIMERLRAEPGDTWVRIEAPIGHHGPEAVEAALAALEAEGLLERHPSDGTRCRLPLA